MYDFIEISALTKFVISVFAPIFAAFVSYRLVCTVIDLFKRAAND